MSDTKMDKVRMGDFMIDLAKLLKRYSLTEMQAVAGSVVVYDKDGRRTASFDRQDDLNNSEGVCHQ